VHYISILSTVVAFIFTISVFERYRRRGGMHLLLWGIGLFLFGLGTLTEVIMLFNYSNLILKVWYLSGAMLTAAWLGQGTVHLLVRKTGIAKTLTLMLTIVSFVAAILIFTAPVNAAAAYDLSQPASAQYQDILVRSGIIIMPTLGGTFIRIGLADWLYLSEFLGIILMYAGFIKATSVQPADNPQTAETVSSI
jgi:hypothetical protein